MLVADYTKLLNIQSKYYARMKLINYRFSKELNVFLKLNTWSYLERKRSGPHSYLLYAKMFINI